MSAEVRQAFGNRVRSLRRERDISLRKFADTIGMDKSYLSSIELGRKSPTLDTIERIASGLDVTMSFLLFEVETRRTACSYDGTSGGAKRP